MNKFWIVLSDQQQNGLANITRYKSYEVAYAAACAKARQFTDSVFIVAEAQQAILCPPTDVVTYTLHNAVREVA
jgi:hypothetical protein